MRLLVIAGAALLVLAGCSRLIGENQTRSEMQASKAAYTDCLRGDPQDISVCETLRLIYEADLEAYKAAKVPGSGFRASSAHKVGSSLSTPRSCRHCVSGVLSVRSDAVGSAFPLLYAVLLFR